MIKINKKGFTLIELMVVIVIIGVLAAVAIPKFLAASHKAKASEAPTVLSAIYNGEGAYQNENGSYTSSLPSPSSTATTSQIDVSIPGSRYFSYGNLGTNSTFTAFATITTAFGDASKDLYAFINDGGTKSCSNVSLTNYMPTWRS